MARTNHNPTTTAPGIKLTRHVKGWVAKIGGKVKWLAPLDKPQLALERYHQKMSEYRASLESVAPVADNNVSLGVIGQLFVDSKLAKVQAGELKPRTYDGYLKGIARATKHFGEHTIALNIPPLRWQQYRAAIAEKFDVHTLARYVGAVRALSKWASQNDYIDRPFRFGTEFNLPSQKAIRAAKADAGHRVWTPEQVKKMKSAPAILRAMFLLSINGGVGNTDIANLADANVKEDRIEFARSKTGVARVIPAWPETVAAIKAARAIRPDPAKPEWSNRIFLTERGHPYVRDHIDEQGNLTSTTDKISVIFWTELKRLEIERSFYDGRRTFQTIADEIGPPHVVRAIMGHAARGEDMSSRYRQSIPFEQSLAVVNHVRKRLHVAKNFPSQPESVLKSGAAA